MERVGFGVDSGNELWDLLQSTLRQTVTII
jgi:hypothetical protein